MYSLFILKIQKQNFTADGYIEVVINEYLKARLSLDSISLGIGNLDKNKPAWLRLRVGTRGFGSMEYALQVILGFKNSHLEIFDFLSMKIWCRGFFIGDRVNFSLLDHP